MNTARSERIAVMVVRLWLEDNVPGAIRARLTQASDLSSEETEVLVASNTQTICDAVCRWATDFAKN